MLCWPGQLSPQPVTRRAWIEDRARRQRPADQGACDEAEFLVVVAGVGAQRTESGVHVDLPGLGEEPLGLLDHDPAVQCVLELFSEDRGTVDAALLEDSDGGHIGQRAGDPPVREA